MRARVEPEDFVVEEIPLYAPRGEGAHTFVQIEKRLRTTEEVARALARMAGVVPSAVGYAGRKDRHAVTRQWFSVPGLDPGQAEAWEAPGLRVLAASRHDHKLRTGQLRGNRFAIRLRDLEAGVRPLLEDALRELVREGMPNRFGTQRFGRDGRNAERGSALLLGVRDVGDRREARFLLSALQSAIFNAVLEQRPRPLARLERGDVAVVHASGGLFRVDDPAREQPRADRFEISPTGPMVGSRGLAPTGAVGEAERAALAARGLEPAILARPPRGLRLRGGRRALRVCPAAVRVERLCDGGLRLQVELPPGSYASVLLEELAGRCGSELRLGSGALAPTAH